jgi:ribosomal protein S18 acetylase RimI-like enzyme
MQIRPGAIRDLDQLPDIDGTIESTRYLHLERIGDGLNVTFRLEERDLRSKLIDSNRMGDEHRFQLKQIVGGVDDGLCLVAEHEGAIVAVLAAQPVPDRGVFRLIDLRVDYDSRRQGLASAMIFQLISAAREQGLRAVMAETQASNFPAARLLSKLGFDLAGLDTQRRSNHDVVKEAATLVWYLSLD